MSREAEASSYIGYGITFRLPGNNNRNRSLGYADGYQGYCQTGVCIDQRQKYPIAGRVCMDQFMVDVGNDQANTGDIVTLLGRDGQEGSPSHVGSMAQTISNEILTVGNTKYLTKYVRMQT